MITINPGEGWRLLVRGEVKQDGDEFFYDRDRKWHPVYYVGHVLRSKEIIRRRIEPVDNTGVEVHTGGPYVAIEVHRAALAEIERLKAELSTHRDIWTLARDIAAKERDAAEQEVKRLKAELDAVKHSRPSPEPEWFDLTPFGEHVLRRNIDWGGCGDPAEWRRPNWPPVTITVDTAKSWGWEQFRCLLKDAPPELVAMAKESQCIHTFDCGSGDHSDACPASVPVESPDDWVTQDRVPARVGIDERRWIRKDVKTTIPDLANWKDCFEASACFRDKAVNGFEHPNEPGLFLELRCRRRDLPPLPQ